MTNENKPTSKVIQIQTCFTPEGHFNGSCFITTILCEDGSMWERDGRNDWQCVLEANTNAK